MVRTADSRVGAGAMVACLAALALAAATPAIAGPGGEPPPGASLDGPAAVRSVPLATAAIAPRPSIAAAHDGFRAPAPVFAGAGPSPWKAHFLPRLNGRFDGIASRDPLAVLGLGDDGSNAHRDLADVAARGAHRAAERALADWGLALTDLDARVDAWLGRRVGATDGADGAGRGAPSVSFGVAHLLPRIDLTWAVGDRSTVRLLVRGDGEAGVELSRRGAGARRIFAGWERDDDRLRVQFRRSF